MKRAVHVLPENFQVTRLDDATQIRLDLPLQMVRYVLVRYWYVIGM